MNRSTTTSCCRDTFIEPLSALAAHRTAPREALDRVLGNPGSLIRPHIVASMFAAYGLPCRPRLRARYCARILPHRLAALRRPSLHGRRHRAPRRSLPSTLEFGEAGAILTALALINRAYALTWKPSLGSSPANQTEALDYIEHYLGVGGLLNGQSMDLNYEPCSAVVTTSPKPSPCGKTVSLIRLTLVLPGILGGAAPDETPAPRPHRRLLGPHLSDRRRPQGRPPHLVGKPARPTPATSPLGRPNIALAIGIPAAVQRLTRLIAIGDRIAPAPRRPPTRSCVPAGSARPIGRRGERLDREACEHSVHNIRPTSLQGAS